MAYSTIKTGNTYEKGILYKEFLIQSVSDLANLPNCAVGSVAYTADFSIAAVKDIDGSWVYDV